jgi:hypothetical protein
MAALREIIEARLSGMDQLMEIMNGRIDQRQGIMVAELSHMSLLYAEKFSNVAVQFAERDKRMEQLSAADKTAIAAALQAQKEAASAQNESNVAANVKMETNFVKLIDQGSALVAEIRRNTETQINDLKSRMDKGEGRSKGAGELWGYLLGFSSILIALGALVVAVLK